MARTEQTVSDYSSSLTAVVSIGTTDIFMVNQGGTMKSATGADVQVLSVNSVATESADFDVPAVAAYIAFVTAGSVADVTATLPDATTVSGYVFRIMKADTGSKNVVIDTDGGTINGQTSIDLVTQYDYLYVVSDGTNYIVLDFKITYSTGWVSNSDWTDLTATITHNMNITMNKITTDVLLSSNGTDANTIRVIDSNYTNTTGGLCLGIQINNASADTVTFQTGSFGVLIMDANGDEVLLQGSSAYYYQINLERNKI